MSESTKKSAWGVGIFVFYGVFIVFILALVLYVSLQDMQMVTEDYYAKDLVYQQHIDKVRQSQELTEGLKIEPNPGKMHIMLTFPADMSPDSIGGTVTLFRPSNARLDKVIDIAPDKSGQQAIDIAGLVRGNWRIRIDWSCGSRSFYSEDVLYLQ
ncbi:MAG: FixH family protein [Candidatus Zixiibacteriota bacterium]